VSQQRETEDIGYRAEEREKERALEKKRASRPVCSGLAWSRTGLQLGFEGGWVEWWVRWWSKVGSKVKAMVQARGCGARCGNMKREITALNRQEEGGLVGKWGVPTYDDNSLAPVGMGLCVSGLEFGPFSNAAPMLL
jgi:hypothetical protein